MEYELAIHGATIVTSGLRTRKSIYVANGKIAALTEEHHPAKREFDAAGLYLLPGVIDGHVHLMDPPEIDREDFITGSSAAAVGGVTTIVEHNHSQPVKCAAELREKAEYLKDRSLVDFGLGVHVWPDRLEELSELWAAGPTFLKMFTVSTHGVPAFTPSQMLQAFRTIAEISALGMVHCEDESISVDNGAGLQAAGRTDGALLLEWRTRESEMIALNTVALIARLTGARISMAHISCPAALEIAAVHRTPGTDMWFETCCRYLYVWERDVAEYGPYRKFTPPARIRSRWEAEEMWRKVAFGPITHISSDHGPAQRYHKDKGIWDSPSGIPELESYLSLLLEGVNAGYLSLERVVHLTSENPAKMFRLYPRKGAIKVGADADLVLVDLEAKRQLTDEATVSKSSWNPFADLAVRGSPVTTFVRGNLVAERGRPVATPGWGKFIPGPGAR